MGSDHAGFRLKESIKEHLLARGYRVTDFGTHSEKAVDYPDFVRPAAEAVSQGRCELGIVFGGSGNGEAMVANKVRGIRCGLCWDVKSARLAKEHNNANMISLGGRMVSEEEGKAIVDAWLEAEFQGDRHIMRIEKMEM
jgi:ribose 5-phosphate isomerase B